MKYYIGIDLGGTNIKAGVVNEEFEIIAKATCKTNLPRPAEEICEDMAKGALAGSCKERRAGDRADRVCRYRHTWHCKF